MEEASFIHVSMERVNIYYDVMFSKLGDMSSLNWFVENLRHEGQSAEKVIIYCRNVSTVASVYEFFSLSLGEKQFIDDVVSLETRLIAMFHRSTADANKELILSQFKKPSSSIRLVIATSSFEMGLDFPDVSIVVNYGAPRSLESFSQQSGRGGRKIPQAYSLIIYQNASIGKGATTDEMRKLVTSTSLCRRKILMSHFSIDLDKERDCHFSLSEKSPVGCKCCDICREKCQCSECVVVPWHCSVDYDSDDVVMGEVMLADDMMTDSMLEAFRINLKEYREVVYEEEYGENSIVSGYWSSLVERLMTSYLIIIKSIF